MERSEKEYFISMSPEQQYETMKKYITELDEMIERLTEAEKNVTERDRRKIELAINAAIHSRAKLECCMADYRLSVIDGIIEIASGKITKSNKKHYEDALGGAPCLTDSEAKEYKTAYPERLEEETDESELEEPIVEETEIDYTEYKQQAIPGFSQQQNTAFQQYSNGWNADRIATYAGVYSHTVYNWLNKFKKLYPDLGKSLRKMHYSNRKSSAQE